MVLETWCLVLEFFHKQCFKHKLMQKNSPQIKEAPPTQLHPLVHIQSFCVQNTDGQTDPLMTSLSESLLEVNSYKVDQRDATRPKRRRKANWAQNKVQQGVEHPATRRETWPHTRAHIHPEQTQIRAAETRCLQSCACISQSDLLLRGTGGGVFSKPEPGGSALIIHQNSHSINAAGLQTSAALRTHSENKCSSQRHSINRFIIHTHTGCFLKPTAATAASYREEDPQEEVAGVELQEKPWREREADYSQTDVFLSVGLEVESADAWKSLKEQLCDVSVGVRPISLTQQREHLEDVKHIPHITVSHQHLLHRTPRKI